MRIRQFLAAVLCIPALLAREPVRAKNAMVVAQEPLAADAGLAVLKAGGNAIDAAVATGFALAVTHPFAGNLGGGGFMLIRLANGTTSFIDFREKAPKSASRDMYVGPDGKLTRDSLVGWRASGVPGSVRGFELAHKRFGKKSWGSTLDPAIKLADKGIPVSYALAESLKNGSKLLERFDESKRIFLKGGNLYEPGDTFRQRELAATLKRIKKYGAKDFYEGEIARKFAAAEQANGGTIALEDLNAYQAAERKPITGHYRGYDVITSPPPSSGGIGILQMMGMLEGSDYTKGGPGSAAAIHYVSEAMRRFYADRSEYFGDPDFFKVPIPKLLDPRYIASRRESIDPLHASSSESIKPGTLPPTESTETTHFNVVDREGNAVAVTYTLNGGYGSGVTVPGLGFLLNNEMDDFAAKPGEPNLFGLIQGEANAIQPGKRPLSSMTPTMLAKDGKLFMLVGAPGGSRIINGVLEVILNVVDFHMNAQEAVDWPRFHHQWMPDKLYLENGVSPDTIALLKSMGHNVESSEKTAVVIARVEAIVIDKGWIQGGSDGRGPGKAVGF